MPGTQRAAESSTAARTGGGFADWLRRDLENASTRRDSGVDGAATERRRNELLAPALTPVPVPYCAVPAPPPAATSYLFLELPEGGWAAGARADPAKKDASRFAPGCPVPATPNAPQAAELRHAAEHAPSRPAPQRPAVSASPDAPTPEGAPAGELAFALRVRHTADGAGTPGSPSHRPAAQDPPHALPAGNSSPAQGAASPVRSAGAGDEHSDLRPALRQIPVLTTPNEETVDAVAGTSRTDFTRSTPSHARVDGRDRGAMPRPEVKAPPPHLPSDAALKSIERLEALAAARQAAGTAQEIVWKAEIGGGANVWLRLTRGGVGLRAEVNSGDSVLTRVLRGNVNELVAALRRQGFEADVQPLNALPSAASQPDSNGGGQQSRGRRQPLPEDERHSPDGKICGPAWMEQWMQVFSGRETNPRTENL